MQALTYESGLKVERGKSNFEVSESGRAWQILIKSQFDLFLSIENPILNYLKVI